MTLTAEDMQHLYSKLQNSTLSDCQRSKVGAAAAVLQQVPLLPAMLAAHRVPVGFPATALPSQSPASEPGEAAEDDPVPGALPPMWKA